MPANKDKTAQIFESYISTRRIVIADTNASSRAGLARTMINLGAKTTNIAILSTYEEAVAEIARNKPQVVICDFDLGKYCGLNLLQEQRKQNPESKDTLFVLVTGNTSQSAVAQAAEEDVDTFILKPYTLEMLRQSMMKAALAKINPSTYHKTIEEGKKLLFGGKPEEAIAIFEKAIPMDPKPALACFYKGQALLAKQVADEAKGSYDKGLDHNKIHYKCLIGLYELLMEQKKFTEAYEAVKKVSRYFPANPQRLTEVLRLAVINQKFEDIERYYQVFTTIDQRNNDLIKYVCAALVVCGKYYLTKSANSRALDLFQKAATTGTGRTKILREIISVLVAKQMINDCEVFLKRFPADTMKGEDFAACEYMIANASLTADLLVDRGRKYIKAGVHDPLVYRILIQRSREAGLSDYADTLIQEASTRWPAQKDDFTAAGQAPAGGKDEKSKAPAPASN
ncbi:MAG: response regulator [Bacteriovoracia bacterium]